MNKSKRKEAETEIDRTENDGNEGFTTTLEK